MFRCDRTIKQVIYTPNFSHLTKSRCSPSKWVIDKLRLNEASINVMNRQARMNVI